MVILNHDVLLQSSGYTRECENLRKIMVRVGHPTHTFGKSNVPRYKRQIRETYTPGKQENDEELLPDPRAEVNLLPRQTGKRCEAERTDPV